MAKLKERPIKITDLKDFTPENNENVMRHYDELFRTMDNRRIAQQSKLASGATTAQIITALNALITALNNSDLTEES